MRNFLKYRALAVVAAFALVLYAIFSKSPGGFFDDFVWPVAYVCIAGATLIAAFRPSRETLRVWASLLIGTEVMRAVSLALFPYTNDTERWARFGIHVKVAVLAYFVWVGWRLILSTLEHEQRREADLPIKD